jgi:hypothetical protein
MTLASDEDRSDPSETSCGENTGTLSILNDWSCW